jgi:hypothetical protein
MYHDDDNDPQWIDLDEDVDETVTRDFDILNGNDLTDLNIGELQEGHFGEKIAKGYRMLLKARWFAEQKEWRIARLSVIMKRKAIKRARRQDGSLDILGLWELVPVSTIIVSWGIFNFYKNC